MLQQSASGVNPSIYNFKVNFIESKKKQELPLFNTHETQSIKPPSASGNKIL